MRLNENLTTEATKAMAQLRRSLQGELNINFKLADNDQVIKMLKYAELSDDMKVEATLDCFLAELPTEKRVVLSEKGINGSLPSVSGTANTEESENASSTGVEGKKKSRRLYRGQPVSD
jgi:hypothetical protein